MIETAPSTTLTLNQPRFTSTTGALKSLRQKTSVWVKYSLHLLHPVVTNHLRCSTFLNTTPLCREWKMMLSIWLVDWHRKSKSMIITCFQPVWRLILIFKLQKKSLWSSEGAVRHLVSSVTDLSLLWAAWLARISRLLCVQLSILTQTRGSILPLYHLRVSTVRRWFSIHATYT